MNRPPKARFLIALTVCVLTGCATSQPKPQKAPPAHSGPQRVACTTSWLPTMTPAAPTLVLPNARFGGMHMGGSGTVAGAITLDPTARDLVIVTQGNLTIGANIRFSTRSAPAGASSPKIILVSRNGRLNVRPGVTIGGGMNRTAAPGWDQGPGQDGGRIELYGNRIDIDGNVYGHGGGHGYSATLSAAAPPSRTVIGTNGGRGGDVFLCAKRAIRIGASGLVEGGEGGAGGLSTANARTDVKANAGSGGQGGDVYVVGLLSTVPAVITNNGSLLGGDGGDPGKATALVQLPSNPNKGGNAEAKSGNGGAGGTVKFRLVSVRTNGTVRSGDGGTAGAITTVTTKAVGGPGSNGRWLGGYKGGDAKAIGGKGGVAGTTPLIPTPRGNVAGVRGKHGSGATAQGKAGSGGRAGSVGGSGGRSGDLYVKGGENGAGVSPGTPVNLRSRTVTGVAGGSLPVKTVQGAP